jgi:outer membrane protein assembly factor BamA
MGTISDNPRKRFVGLRFTEGEFEQIESQMKKADYISISKFIRDRALNKQIKVRKNIILTDRNLRNMINDITTRIAKIGVDYNQATKQLNALSKKQRADGSPVINARAANYYLNKVALMTKDLKEQMDLVINMVDRLEKETNDTTN